VIHKWKVSEMGVRDKGMKRVKVEIKKEIIFFWAWVTEVVYR
jgi:hypothetical protein